MKTEFGFVVNVPPSYADISGAELRALRSDFEARGSHHEKPWRHSPVMAPRRDIVRATGLMAWLRRWRGR